MARDQRTPTGVTSPSCSQPGEAIGIEESLDCEHDLSCVPDKKDNLCNPLKTQSAKNAISAIKLFAFPAKTEPVLPYILEE
ncbi:hypothetical protein TNCV_1031091 [Trichonephila clavipes]|nr:hypothetical protein TNCV_1031091 [Trichonephila clavipes]